VDEILGDKVAIVGAVPGRRGEVNLVEVVEDAVHGVEDGAVRVVLAAAVLIHQVELRRILERLAAELVARVAGAVEAV